jgi:hypothetical protein
MLTTLHYVALLGKRAIEMLGPVSHFQMEVEGDRLVLTPARLGAADAVRRKLDELGVTEADVADAVAWEYRAHFARIAPDNAMGSSFSVQT